ncbi:rod shape-determining protein MreC [Croceivirga thetidis]|uniref:Cell shape-determining protein MreC n=1 Tax=Croceivirga thetidis TaxID=2721623 RepID=A0ABX1GP53_9FLAO|nr:rod shape-determining protein MreC [Croceivirga thetidis]NKI31700.1 rod shape-determining protein MreC [Croceivirga thetidis]
MQRLLDYILSNRNTFLFGILLLISLTLTFRSHSYHQSKVFNSSRWLTGNVYQISNNLTSYFDLREANEVLLEENRLLRNQLFNQQNGPQENTDSENWSFEVIGGVVINNSYNSPNNYITINKGKKHGLVQDMGVITSKGLLGIVENTSLNFATVQSLLNTKSIINAKIKNTNYFGSLTWDTENYNEVQLVDIPKSVPLVVGDTIVTGGMSSIFPENIPIGVIKKYDLNTSKSFYTIDVGLFNDMANLNAIYVIKSRYRREQIQLENSTRNAN